MTATQTRIQDLRQVINDHLPGSVEPALAEVNLGNMLSTIKLVVTGLTAAAAFVIPNIPQTSGSGVTVTWNGINLNPDGSDVIPAVGEVVTLRVTNVGTAAVGPRVVTDVGGTPGAPGANGPGIATISDDGTTITFEGTVTGFILTYQPRSTLPLTTEYRQSAP